MILTEERILELVNLATRYAIRQNLDAAIYVNSMLNCDTVGEHDPYFIVEKLIKYHTDWLSK